MDVAALYRRHGAMVLRRARRLLDDEHAARDVLHDVFVTLHERRAALADLGLTSWLYVVTTNLCLKRLRAAAVRTRLASAIAPPRPAGPTAEDLAALRGALAAVPDELAAVAIFRFIDEMTHAEIADVLGCSRRHVGDLLRRFERATAPARENL
jgi:RNA polymerase sigma-70 factor (ECF subfamily)